MSQRQIPTRSTPIEEVERMNAVMARSHQLGVGLPQRNLYAMDVDRSQNRNCYTYKRFEHMVRHYKSRRAEMNRRMD